jgi:hypothetical protein
MALTPKQVQTNNLAKRLMKESGKKEKTNCKKAEVYNLSWSEALKKASETLKGRESRTQSILGKAKAKNVANPKTRKPAGLMVDFNPKKKKK